MNTAGPAAAADGYTSFDRGDDKNSHLSRSRGRRHGPTAGTPSARRGRFDGGQQVSVPFDALSRRILYAYNGRINIYLSTRYATNAAAAGAYLLYLPGQRGGGFYTQRRPVFVVAANWPISLLGVFFLAFDLSYYPRRRRPPYR